MNLNEFTNEQIRQLVDTEQVFQSWREARQEFKHGYVGSYKGKMKWRRRGKTEYLYRIIDGVETSLGPRSPKTEEIKERYVVARNRLTTRIRYQKKRLTQIARVNRALRLNRVPKDAAQVLMKLDDEGLLGTHLIVVGTNALFAYEMRAGVFLEGSILATEDFDFLYDARRSLRLLSSNVKREGLIGLLKATDSSFKRSKQTYRASNKAGYYVDLIRPEEKIECQLKDKLGESDDDLLASPIRGLQWLINAPRFDAMSIGQDGMPLIISTVDPRVYALHKLWISKTAKLRGPKKRRDISQARIVAHLAQNYMGLNFDDKSLTALPSELMEGADQLIEMAKSLEQKI